MSPSVLKGEVVPKPAPRKRAPRKTPDKAPAAKTTTPKRAPRKAKSKELALREDGIDIRGTADSDAAYRAYKLHLGGKSWEEVAKLTGYANGRTAQVSVRQYITQAAVSMDVEKKAEVLDIEMARLDVLQDAHWDNAVSGDDVKSAEFVLKVMGHRAKLLGLELVAQGGAVTNNTVVIRGNSEEYIRGLRLVDGIVDD